MPKNEHRGRGWKAALMTAGAVAVAAVAVYLTIGPELLNGQTTYTSDSCSEADVESAIALTSPGDTVVISATGSPCAWTGAVSYSGITVTGAGSCTLAQREITLSTGGTMTFNVPTSCPVVIQDNVQSGPLLVLSGTAATPTRLTNLEFEDGGRASANTEGIIVTGVQTEGDGSTTRVDHIYANQLNGVTFRPEAMVGVFDHVHIDSFGSRHPFLVIGGTLSGEFGDLWGDGIWADGARFGQASGGVDATVYIEQSDIENVTAGTPYTCADAWRGARYVARYNITSNCSWSAHGLDSGQRDRGTQMVELYENEMTTTSTDHILDLRSGAALIWGNTLDVNFNKAADLILNRTTGPNDNVPFHGADGVNPVDVNDAGNPFTTGTVASATQGTLTVSGTPWTTDQWVGFIVHKTTCAYPHSCGQSVISSNTNNTLTFMSDHMGNFISFAMSDTFDINKVTYGYDQPGRSGGTTLSRQTANCTSEGTTATCTTGTHGYSTNDIIIVDVGSNYRGVFQITVTATDMFTFIYPGGGGSEGGYVWKLPGGANDQVTEPVYGWLNNANGTDISTFTPHASCTPFSCIENDTFYQYVAPGSFDGTVGVSSGSRASRPASTTNGVAWWSTDQGGDWNSEVAGANDGCLDKVVAGAWSNCVYTPAVFPHALNVDDTPPAPNTGRFMVR